MSRADIIAYLSRIGTKGGQSKSAAKRAAAQRNGRKGGYPKGKPRTQTKRSAVNREEIRA